MSTLKQWNESAEWYDLNMGEAGDELNNKIIRPVVLDLSGNLKGKIVLDAGCGSGYFTAELARTAKQVVGTDFSDNFVNLCQKKYKKLTNLSFLKYDVDGKSLFSDKYFDLIISKMVLQYVDNIDVFAEESFRILKQSGNLIIAIDHPFHAQFYFAQQEAGKSNPKYPNLKNYFSTEPANKKSLWGKVKLTWYPRTISDYVNTFIKVGYEIKIIKELAREENGVVLPSILILEFIKPISLHTSEV